jgi:hypothetical protein
VLLKWLLKLLSQLVSAIADVGLAFFCPSALLALDPVGIDPFNPLSLKLKTLLLSLTLLFFLFTVGKSGEKWGKFSGQLHPANKGAQCFAVGHLSVSTTKVDLRCLQNTAKTFYRCAGAA